jgi:hypothetical protein
MMILLHFLLLVTDVWARKKTNGDVTKFGCHETKVEHPYNEEDMCFVAGVSDNHINEYWHSLASIQSLYPCARKFVYNLKLNDSLPSFRNLKDVTILTDAIDMAGHQGSGMGRYVVRNAKIFKPPMLLGFIDGYKTLHHCQVAFYADSSVTLTHRFDTAAFNELHRHGVVGQLPSGVSCALVHCVQSEIKSCWCYCCCGCCLCCC